MESLANMGGVDRVARILIGVALIVFAWYGPEGFSGQWLGWIGVIPIVTALIGWCPAYSLFGLRTNKSD